MSGLEIIGTEDPHESARRTQLMDAFDSSCAASGIPVSLACAIARKETSFRNIRSAAGARDDVLGGAFGPMQVTSATARDMGYEPHMSLSARGERILSDPAIGISLGCKLLAKYRAMLGGDKCPIADMVAAYNCGPGRVPLRVPTSTRVQYVPPVMKWMVEYAPLDAVAEVDAFG